MLTTILNFLKTTGIAQLFSAGADGDLMGTLGPIIMILLSFILLYLAIGKGFEPLLLVPIAVGMLLTNFPGGGLIHMEFFMGDKLDFASVFTQGGLIDILYLGVKLGVYPSLIFIGIGAMTDFSPLIANPHYFQIGRAHV